MAGSRCEGGQGHGSGAQPPPPINARDGFYLRDRPSPLEVSHGGVSQAQGHYQR